MLYYTSSLCAGVRHLPLHQLHGFVAAVGTVMQPNSHCDCATSQAGQGRADSRALLRAARATTSSMVEGRVTSSSQALGDCGSALGFMLCHHFWRQHVIGAALHLGLLPEHRVQPPQPGLANV